MGNVVNLSKGGVVNLSKHAPGLTNVMVGLGWDPVDKNESKKGFFASLFNKQPVSRGEDIDCDAYAIVLTGGRLNNNSGVVYFGNKSYLKGVIKHMGDNLTGHDVEGQADDENILISLDKLPKDVDGVVLGVNIYSALSRGQTFGSIKNAYIRLVDQKTNAEICKYMLSDSGEYKDATNVIMGVLRFKDNSWEFLADGTGSVVKSIGDVASNYT